jgi:glucuronosyltransferase
VYEAVDAGVPVLGFPLYYDQPRNVGNLVEAGMALSMDLLTVNKIAFLEKINELINDKKYVNL